MKRIPKEVVTLHFHCKIQKNLDDIIKKIKVENTINELAVYLEEEFANALDALDWFEGKLELTVEKGKQKRHIEFDMKEEGEDNGKTEEKEKSQSQEKQ